MLPLIGQNGSRAVSLYSLGAGLSYPAVPRSLIGSRLRRGRGDEEQMRKFSEMAIVLVMALILTLLSKAVAPASDYSSPLSYAVSQPALIAANIAEAELEQAGALLGTWELNSEKSTVAPGPPPYQTMTLSFSATERGLRMDAKGVNANGSSIEAVYLIVEDGKYHPVTGIRNFDSSSYTRVSDRNTVYVRKKHGATVVVGSRTVSRDGKTLTFRQKTVDEFGRETGRALLVFEKQQTTS